MQVEVGQILQGKVTGVKKFGAFVRLSNGTTGMVHISEVSNEYVQELSDVLSEGQEVNVKVLSIAEDGKVALSIKQTQEKPQREQRAPKAQRPASSYADPGRVWQPKQAAQATGSMGFEDMMSKFKTQSEEKISDLKRATEGRRGSGGYSRRR